MDELEQIKQTFFQECDELLSDLETGLLAMERGASDDETVNAVFRAVHSVKGGAGAFGLENLVGFAHVFETTLDELRSGRLASDENLIGVLLRSADVLADHVAAARDGGVVVESRTEEAKAELVACLGGGAAAAPPAKPLAQNAPEAAPDEFGFVPQKFNFAAFDLPAAAPPPPPASAPSGPPEGWTVVFRPHTSLYAKANEPVVLLRELARLGTCETVLDADQLPTLDGLQPEDSYLSWTITLKAACAEADVREVFEFVDGECDLSITPWWPPSVEIEPAPSAQRRAAGPPALSLVEPSRSSDDERAVSLPTAPDGSALAAADNAKKSAAAAEADRATAAGANATIRVELDRIDRLINLVGELVIHQAMLSQQAHESGFSPRSTFGAGLDDLEQLTREIQDSVMAVRAQPVKSVFQRMPRLVREVASLTGKQVRLVTEGEGAEVDKTVIERLTDPITHMIRNAIDHGLETPERRLAAGKPAEGCVRLAALHRSGRIVIEVSDDGAGINRERVQKIAVTKGLVAPDAILSEEEIDNLIFLPGFSTADAVSNISGRGVGMDVVKRSIQALGGRITITSVPGQGSRFTMSLPLTLAVLDGMVVSVGDQTLVVPLSAIIETLRPKSKEIQALGPNAHVVAVRDAHVPLIDVGQLIGCRKEPLNPTTGVCLLVECEVGGRAALLVDSIQGQRQVVIKSLEANYQKVDLVAAATILGDGRVALILDVDALIASRGRDGVRQPIAFQMAS